MAVCYLYSFDYSQWEALLSGADATLLARLEETLRNPDFFTFDDPDHAVETALRAARRGLPYGEFPRDDADMLDCVVFAALKCPGRLAKSLDCAPRSRQPATVPVLEAVAEKAPAAAGPLFDALLDGRRHGVSGEAPDCGHAMFNPAEVQALAAAAEGITARLAGSPQAAAAETQVLGVLRELAQDPSRGLIAFLE